MRVLECCVASESESYEADRQGHHRSKRPKDATLRGNLRPELQVNQRRDDVNDHRCADRAREADRRFQRQIGCRDQESGAV